MAEANYCNWAGLRISSRLSSMATCFLIKSLVNLVFSLGLVEMTKIFLEGDNTLSGSSISDSFDLITRYYYLDKVLILAYQRLFSKFKTVHEEKSRH